MQNVHLLVYPLVRDTVVSAEEDVSVSLSGTMKSSMLSASLASELPLEFRLELLPLTLWAVSAVLSEDPPLILPPFTLRSLTMELLLGFLPLSLPSLSVVLLLDLPLDLTLASSSLSLNTCFVGCRNA